MSKIIITGGLGYVGTQLCKLHIPETLENEIIVSDRRFLPERVKELKEWGFKYVQSDLLDRDTIKELVQDADIVYHLGGITDVAYVKTESNEGKDKLIANVGVEGSRNIINNLSTLSQKNINSMSLFCTITRSTKCYDKYKRYSNG